MDNFERECIYVVKAISCYELKEEDLLKNFEIHKLKYNKSSMSYESYLDFLKGWKQDKYEVSGFDSSFHKTKEDALLYATKNIGDINEAGAYMYASVSPVPLDIAYFNSEINKEDIILLKYNREKDEYEIISKEDEEDEAKYEKIIHYVWGFI